MAGDIEITLFSFAPSVTLFSFGTDEVHDNAADFRANPNLFTAKDGLVFIEALPSGNSGVASEEEDWDQYVFADVNGDDWFYFEDTTTESVRQGHCAKSTGQSTFNAPTISGSDTTLINFAYQRTPPHRVLHEGRCNFAGLKTTSSYSQRDPDAKRFRVQSEDL